jgi:hypothetical protein
MISLALAVQLKEAGLVWQTTPYDFFGIPERDMDDRIFVISDMMVTMELLQGWPAITFHGTAEWASDYLWTHEAIWLPTEEQLRHELTRLLAEKGVAAFSLQWQDGRYTLQYAEKVATAETAVNAYAHALLHLLTTTP